MFPAMAAAYNSLPRTAVPRATTAINILQRVGGSLGTAVLVVVLETHMAAVVGPAAATNGLAAGAPPPAVAAGLADAFGSTFWWVMAITALAMVPRWSRSTDVPASRRPGGPAARRPRS